MQIVVINRRDKRQYWVDKYMSITTKYKKALTISDTVKVAKIVQRFTQAFRVIVLTNDGEVVKYYA